MNIEMTETVQNPEIPIVFNNVRSYVDALAKRITFPAGSIELAESRLGTGDPVMSPDGMALAARMGGGPRLELHFSERLSGLRLNVSSEGYQAHRLHSPKELLNNELLPETRLTNLVYDMATLKAMQRTAEADTMGDIIPYQVRTTLLHTDWLQHRYDELADTNKTLESHLGRRTVLVAGAAAILAACAPTLEAPPGTRVASTVVATDAATAIVPATATKERVLSVWEQSVFDYYKLNERFGLKENDATTRNFLNLTRALRGFETTEDGLKPIDQTSGFDPNKTDVYLPFAADDLVLVEPDQGKDLSVFNQRKLIIKLKQAIPYGGGVFPEGSVFVWYGEPKMSDGTPGQEWLNDVFTAFPSQKGGQIKLINFDYGDKRIQTLADVGPDDTVPPQRIPGEIIKVLDPTGRHWLRPMEQDSTLYQVIPTAFETEKPGGMIWVKGEYIPQSNDWLAMTLAGRGLERMEERDGKRVLVSNKGEVLAWFDETYVDPKTNEQVGEWVVSVPEGEVGITRYSESFGGLTVDHEQARAFRLDLAQSFLDSGVNDEYFKKYFGIEDPQIDDALDTFLSKLETDYGNVMPVGLKLFKPEGQGFAVKVTEMGAFAFDRVEASVLGGTEYLAAKSSGRIKATDIGRIDNPARGNPVWIFGLIQDYGAGTTQAPRLKLLVATASDLGENDTGYAKSGLPGVDIHSADSITRVDLYLEFFPHLFRNLKNAKTAKEILNLDIYFGHKTDYAVIDGDYNGKNGHPRFLTFQEVSTP